MALVKACYYLLLKSEPWDDLTDYADILELGIDAIIDVLHQFFFQNASHGFPSAEQVCKNAN